MAWKRLILFLFIFSVSAEASEFKINKITDLDAPWGSTFISDKELLITEKSGKIKLIELKLPIRYLRGRGFEVFK